MRHDQAAVIAAIRAQPWAILPEYLDAIEAIAARAMDADVLQFLSSDGHTERMSENRAVMQAVAAVGTPLEGAAMSTVRDGNAVIPMLGAIFPRASMVNASTGGTSLDAFMRDVRVAETSADVARHVWLVDSPGGVVSGLGEAAEMLRGLQKPTVAFVTGDCASAAYWLAAQAGTIVMDRSARIGSIGVVATTSRQELPGADGRRSHEIVSSGAPQKRPDLSTDEGRAAMQREVDEVEAVFFADVAAGRKVSMATVRADFGQGGMLSAERAVKAGMADRIGTLEGLLATTGSGRTRSSNGAGRRALASAEIETRRRAADRS